MNRDYRDRAAEGEGHLDDLFFGVLRFAPTTTNFVDMVSDDCLSFSVGDRVKGEAGRRDWDGATQKDRRRGRDIGDGFENLVDRDRLGEGFPVEGLGEGVLGRQAERGEYP